MFVVDASAMLAWLFEDERPRNAPRLLEEMCARGMSAPAHWALEIVNILVMSRRADRVHDDQVDEYLALVDSLDVSIDGETSDRAWNDTRVLALVERLTVYDAAYLELALRRDATLASKDRDLLAAAKRRGVPVLDLNSAKG